MNLRSRLELYNLSVIDVANASGLNPRTIERIASGESRGSEIARYKIVRSLNYLSNLGDQLRMEDVFSRNPRSPKAIFSAHGILYSDVASLLDLTAPSVRAALLRPEQAKRGVLTDIVLAINKLLGVGIYSVRYVFGHDDDDEE